MDVILDKSVATPELAFGASIIIVCLFDSTRRLLRYSPLRAFYQADYGCVVFGISVRVLTAIMLMYVFSIELGWLPSFGRGDTANWFGWESGFLNA